jgi:hypothetical protein
MYVVITNFSMAFMAISGVISMILLFKVTFKHVKPSKLNVFFMSIDIVFAVLLGIVAILGIMFPVHAVLNGGLKSPSHDLEMIAIFNIVIGMCFCFFSYVNWRILRRRAKMADYFDNKDRS